MTDDPRNRELIFKLLKLAVSTNSEGEATAAFHKLRRALEKSQVDIHDFIDAPREHRRSFTDTAWNDDPLRAAKRQEEDRKRAIAILDKWDRFLTNEQRKKLKGMKSRRKVPTPSEVWQEYYFLENLYEIISHCQRLEQEFSAKRKSDVETVRRLRPYENVSAETVSPERKAPKAGNGWGGKRKGAGGPRNTEIAAIMNAEGVSRATAYRRRKMQG